MPNFFNGYVVLATNDIKSSKHRCPHCEWSGAKAKLQPIGGCELTPGDPSPAGRCPKCSELAYPDSLEHRMVAYSQSTTDLLKQFVQLQQDLQQGKAVSRKTVDALVKDAGVLLKTIKTGPTVRNQKLNESLVDGR